MATASPLLASLVAEQEFSPLLPLAGVHVGMASDEDDLIDDVEDLKKIIKYLRTEIRDTKSTNKNQADQDVRH